jgi:hypothetical protein
MEFNTFRAASRIAFFILAWTALPLAAQPLPTIPIQPGDLDPATTTAPNLPVVDSVDAKIHAELRVALDANAQGVPASVATSNLPKALRNADEVLVEVRFADTASDALGTLQRHGALYRHSMGATLHEVWIPLSRLRELAAEPDVIVIRPARLARPVIGSKTSEGVAAGNANYWQTFVPSYDGTGIKVAMIDTYDSSKIGSLQTTKDWPATSKLSCYDVKNVATNPPYTPQSCTLSSFGSLGGQHGNATMEIAYDVAPGASFLAYDTVTVGDWYNAILDAAHLNAAGNSTGPVKANVISASLAAPLDGKGDGTALPGSIAEAAGFAKTQGVLVVNAAGNERENHWGGLFALSTSGNGFHSWSGSNTIYNPFGDGAGNVYCVSDGAGIFVDMYWNNWTSPGSTHDYDLYLYQETTSGNWNLVDFSSNPQNGGTGQTPQESIDYTAAAGATTGCPASSAVYAVAVVRVAGTTANDNLQVFASTTEGEPLYYRVNAHSLDFPADSPNVLSIAAIDVAKKTATPQEPFSSEGPVLATGGGLPINPNPLTDTNLKPDAASFDNVTTVTYGAGGKDPPLATAFLGTSASTPHVAGMAALFMQRFGIQTSATDLTNKIVIPLRTIAGTGSNDLGTAGKDYKYGYGRLKFQKETALSFLQQPTNTLVNTAIAPAVKIGIVDTEGKPDIYTLYDSANLAIGTNPAGGTLSGGGTALFVQGVATYSALKIDKGGTGYTLAATSSPNGLVATSNPFNITTGAATKLAFTVQPSTVVAGHVISPTVQVSVEDANGNVVPTGSFSVTLNKTACATTVPAGGGPITTVNGVASFTNLRLWTVASGVALQATATGLTSVISGTFNVTANSDVVFRNGFETCTP